MDKLPLDPEIIKKYCDFSRLILVRIYTKQPDEDYLSFMFLDPYGIEREGFLTESGIVINK